jgi:hypothetical protein
MLAQLVGNSFPLRFNLSSQLILMIAKNEIKTNAPLEIIDCHSKANVFTKKIPCIKNNIRMLHSFIE